MSRWAKMPPGAEPMTHRKTSRYSASWHWTSSGKSAGKAPSSPNAIRQDGTRTPASPAAPIWERPDRHGAGAQAQDGGGVRAAAQNLRGSETPRVPQHHRTGGPLPKGEDLPEADA